MDYFGQRRPASAGGAEDPATRQPQTPGTLAPITPLGVPLNQQLSARSARFAPSSSRPRGPQPVRLRRLPSTPSINVTDTDAAQVTDTQTRNDVPSSRRRSTSEPQRPLSGLSTDTDTGRQRNSRRMETLSEETSQPQQFGNLSPPRSRNRAASDAASSAAEVVLNRPRRSSSTASRPVQRSQNYERDVVDLLDVIDPEVSTLTTLNNVQNSLFIPNLGRFLNRQPTYDLSDKSADPENRPTTLKRQRTNLSRQPTQQLNQIPTVDESKEFELQRKHTSSGSSIFGAPLAHSHSISSHLSESRYAVLPHGVVLEGWTDEDKAELNDHVRHLLHSRKAKFRRSMRAFGKYVRTPLGAFVTIYSFLITFWGTAWVLFIIGWLSVSGRQQYFIMVCDQVLVALFALVGDGLAPFRIVDTYHMYFVAKYHLKTLRLRKEQGLPDLPDMNELPEVSPDGDVEAYPAKPEDAVLSAKEQELLHHHQAKFCKSHTYYRPHETLTHHAFPIKLLIQVVTLLDLHSCFQIALGGTTWGISYKHRPQALTAVILTCSICCNIAGGITISVGDKKTRKKEVVERIFRQALTEEALQKMEKKGIKPTTNEEALRHTLEKGGEATRAVDQQHATTADITGTILTT